MNGIKTTINSTTLLITLFINYWVSAGMYNGKTVGDVSHQHDTLFAPADYAFSIWGAIYLLLLGYVVFQWYNVSRNIMTDEMKREGPWFALSNVLNACWIFAWINEDIGLSLVIMILLLIALVQLVLRLDLERWDAPVRTIFFVWWPICIYLGWIILATVANASAYLSNMGWNGGAIAPETWTIVVILMATVLYILLTFRRCMREASLVGIWGLAAVAWRQWNTQNAIAYAAIGACVVLFVTAVYQGLRNIQTSPFLKIKRGEF